MSEILVDTCVWIDFFSGRPLPRLEEALQEGRVRLSPVVAAELLSGARAGSEQKKLRAFLLDLETPAFGIGHWFEVGALRQKLAKKGLQVSTPDAHVAQAALDGGGLLYSFDQIFKKMAAWIPLKIVD